MLHFKENVWFGVSCFRQIESKLLADVELHNRSYVQKAVCIISRTPLFAFMLNKLHPTTHAYFNQVNFEDRKILYDLYTNIKAVNNVNIEYASLFTGFPLRQLMLFLKEHVMALLKLIIMERKVIIYSHKASIVTGFILSLCSLIPGLLGFGGEQLSSKKVSSYLKSEEMYGLPLHIFNNKTYLIPLFTLNDLDLLNELNGYLIGTTNMLILQLPHIKSDCIVNIDNLSISVENKKLESALKTTTYEQHFVKKLLKSIDNNIIGTTRSPKEYNENNWSCLETMEEGIENYTGSNDFIRKKFAKYFHKFMINLTVAEFICRDFEGIEDKKTEEIANENIKKLKEIFDGLQLSVSEPHSKLTKIKPIKPNSEQISSEPQIDSHNLESHEPENPVLINKFDSIQEDEKHKEIPKEEKERMTKQILQNYNLKFIKEWQFTINYRMWQLIHSAKLFGFSDFLSIFMNY